MRIFPRSQKQHKARTLCRREGGGGRFNPSITACYQNFPPALYVIWQSERLSILSLSSQPKYVGNFAIHASLQLVTRMKQCYRNRYILLIDRVQNNYLSLILANLKSSFINSIMSKLMILYMLLFLKKNLELNKKVFPYLFLQISFAISIIQVYQV